MKVLIYTTIFAMLMIIAFLVWWALIMFSYVNNNLLSDVSDVADRIQLSQIYRAQK